MPSHTWNEVGRWGDSVRANLEAWHSDLKAAIGEGFAIYPEHNLHMLLYAASMDGQGAIAMQAGKDYAKLTGDIVLPGADADPLRPLRRSARGHQAAEARDPRRRCGTSRRATRTCKQGEADFATALSRPRARRPPRPRTAMFRVHTAKNLLGIVAGILEGEIQRTAGDLPGAIATFERAVDAAGRARPTTSRSRCRSRARHWLGAALLEAKRFADAEKVYREELKQHPHNGWSLLGLQQALAGQGKPSAEVDADLAASWSRVGHLDPARRILTSKPQDSPEHAENAEFAENSQRLYHEGTKDTNSFPKRFFVDFVLFVSSW